jgi:N6-L-threonylcarbamoyladenine synthase
LVVDRTIKVVNKYNVKQVILAGGVSANSYLRSQMTEAMNKLNIDINIPPMWCCTDNAAMIAKVAEHLYERKLFADLSLGADPNWRIEDYDKFD